MPLISLHFLGRFLLRGALRHWCDERREDEGDDCDHVTSPKQRGVDCGALIELEQHEGGASVGHEGSHDDELKDPEEGAKEPRSAFGCKERAARLRLES